MKERSLALNIPNNFTHLKHDIECVYNSHLIQIGLLALVMMLLLGCARSSNGSGGLNRTIVSQATAVASNPFSQEIGGVYASENVPAAEIGRLTRSVFSMFMTTNKGRVGCTATGIYRDGDFGIIATNAHCFNHQKPDYNEIALGFPGSGQLYPTTIEEPVLFSTEDPSVETGSVDMVVFGIKIPDKFPAFVPLSVSSQNPTKDEVLNCAGATKVNNDGTTVLMIGQVRVSNGPVTETLLKQQKPSTNLFMVLPEGYFGANGNSGGTCSADGVIKGLVTGSPSDFNSNPIVITGVAPGKNLGVNLATLRDRKVLEHNKNK